MKAVKVLTYQRHYIAAFRPVTTEIGLRRLFLRVLDDELILMTGGVSQDHFDVSAHASRAVEAIAQIIGNVINTNLRFQVFEIYGLFHTTCKYL